MTDHDPQKLWGEKPYHSLDFMLKETFGEKVYKITIDAGFSCPNRQNGKRGCIYCDAGGSFSQSHSANMTIKEQLDFGAQYLTDRFKAVKYMSYFQSFSNTYKPVEELKEISEQTGIEYRFFVSVDGITKETYENTRVGGNFEKVIENICLLRDHFETSIQFCIKKTNCKDAPYIKEFFNNLGFEVLINTDYFDTDMIKYIDESDLIYNQ